MFFCRLSVHLAKNSDSMALVQVFCAVYFTTLQGSSIGPKLYLTCDKLDNVYCMEYGMERAKVKSLLSLHVLCAHPICAYIYHADVTDDKVRISSRVDGYVVFWPVRVIFCQVSPDRHMRVTTGSGET